MIVGTAVGSLIICRAGCGQDRPSRGGTGPHGSGVLGIQISDDGASLNSAGPPGMLNWVVEAFRFARAGCQRSAASQTSG
jgi:hypothetical protein